MALDFPAPFYFDRPWIAEGLLNEPPLKTEIAHARDADDVLRWLHSLDIRWLVVTPGYGGGRVTSLWPLAASRPQLELVQDLKRRLTLVSSAAGVDVYLVPRG